MATPAASRRPLLEHASSRWVRWLPYAVAFGFTIVLIPVTAQALSHEFGLHGGLAGALGVAQAAPLLLSVTRPLPAWWIVFTADVLGALALLGTDDTAGRPWPWPPMMIVGYLVLCLALALRESRRTLLAVWLVTVVTSLALGFVSPERSEGTNVLLIVLSGATLLLGATLRERAEAQRRLAEQETISEAERAQRTLLEERTRIARELHDVVAHHMSVITVQADSAPYRISGIPPEAREEFGTIAATARESLSEMRRLLGVLRSENTPKEHLPQPGLERLEQLVEATVRAGVPAELHVDLGAADDAPEGDASSGASGGGDGTKGGDGTERGDAADRAIGADSGTGAGSGPGRPGPALAQAVTLSAYRIVQEALANVVRHAPGAPTRVSVTTMEHEGTGFLTVLVVNGPSPGPREVPLETTGTGHGLVGMRERVRLVGGTLEVGPLPEGGFRVAARLPLRPPATGGGDDGGTSAGAEGAETATGTTATTGTAKATDPKDIPSA
ncbi:histidine kinase [Streptomyces albus subsp. chlorinus]|nr:histidine kinase [Streptomyces albus]